MGGDVGQNQHQVLIQVSIHATRVGGDPGSDDVKFEDYFVSIHATRVGGDPRRRRCTAFRTCFYPRHPCGWRLADNAQNVQIAMFLSTPPVWVAS